MIAGPSEIRFRSPQEKYELYNFFRQATLDRLVQILLSPEPLPVVLLSGDQGSGRGYLLEAAVHHAGRHGAKAILLPLDLAGYEEGDEGLTRFLDHQVSRQRELSEEARRRRGEQLRSLLHGIEKSVSGAVVLSLLLRLEEPLQALRALGLPTFDDLPGPRRDPSDSVRLLLEHLSAGRLLVLHVEGSSPLDDVTRERLLQAARRNPLLLLAFSCHPRDDSERVAPRTRSRERLELDPLAPPELRAAIEHAFEPCDFPDELYTALARFSRGHPARLVVKMVDLVLHEIIVADDEGNWRLGESGLASEHAAAQLGPVFLDPLDDLLRRLELPEADRLQRFLHVAALCGENIPADLVLRFMGVSEREREELLDRIDLDLVENPNLAILIDHQYGHPSFPGVLVYSFLSPLLNLGLLEALAENRRDTLASEFLKFLQRALPVSTRGIARLFLSLADHVGDAVRREAYLRHLGWWISLDQADELTARVVEDLQRRKVEPMALLSLMEETRYRWPPVQRLAILRALEQSGSRLSREEAVLCHILRADLLAKTFDPEQALREGQLAFELAEALYGPDHRLVATALAATGSALRGLGKLELARDALQEVLSMSLRLHGACHEKVASAHHNLGSALSDLGDVVEARHHFRRALEIEREIRGPEDPRIGRILNGLARTLDDPVEAIACLEEAYRIDREACGEGHFVTAETLSRLGELYISIGKDEQAVGPLTKALAIVHRYYGEDSVQAYQGLVDLAAANVVRQPTLAIDYLARALPIACRHYGERSAEAERARSTLSALREGRLVEPRRRIPSR